MFFGSNAVKHQEIWKSFKGTLDTVEHTGVCHFSVYRFKFLHWLVCRSLDWVVRYLNGRQQFMKMGYRSKSLNIARGVPQGSVLGP